MRVSKKVVIETTATTRVKTKTTVHHAICECQSFECLDRYKNDPDFQVNEDGTITISQERSQEKNGNKLVMTMLRTLTPVIVADGDNYIKDEHCIIEEITKAEVKPQSKKVDLKDILEMMAQKSRPNSSDMSDMIDDLVDSIVKKRKGKSTTDSSEIASKLQELLGRKTNANVKVIDMTNFPTFQEFVKMMKKDE
jgi:hypothetical protein